MGCIWKPKVARARKTLNAARGADSLKLREILLLLSSASLGSSAAFPVKQFLLLEANDLIFAENSHCGVRKGPTELLFMGPGVAQQHGFSAISYFYKLQNSSFIARSLRQIQQKAYRRGAEEKIKT